RDRGVCPDSLVGLHLERSPELIVALLAVLKAGGAYVPLDPSHPKARIGFLLDDSEVPLLLTHSRLESSLPATASQRVLLDREANAIAGRRADNPQNSAGPDHLAYLLYTSGSTGQPKGAMIPHRGLVNYLRWAISAYPAAEGIGAPLHSPM